MSTLRVAAINHPSASSGGLAISASGNVTGAGLDLITTQSFSAVSSVSVNNCFSATYDNYRVLVNASGSADTFLNFRLRASGADASGANYDYQYMAANGATVSASRTTTDTKGQFSYVHSSGGRGGGSLDIFAPALAQVTASLAHTMTPISGAFLMALHGRHALTTAYDGITIYPDTGTMTGTVSIYGYRK